MTSLPVGALLIWLAATFAPPVEIPDGVAYSASPATEEETRFLEGRWRDDDGSGEFIIYRDSTGVLKLRDLAEVVAETKIYVTRHNDDLYISASMHEINPQNALEILRTDGQCYGISRLRRLSNGHINFDPIDPDLTLAANPWLKQETQGTRRPCTTAFLFGMPADDQKRLTLVSIPMRKQHDRSPSHRIGPPQP